MRRGRLRWFEHLKRRSVNDWVSVCRRVEVEGVRRKGRNRKTWKCVDDDMKVLGLRCNPSGQFSGICGGTSHGQTSNILYKS